MQRRVIKKKHKYLLEELKFGATYNPESSTLAANQGMIAGRDYVGGI